METDSSDEQEFYDNTFSSSSSSDDQKGQEKTEASKTNEEHKKSLTMEFQQESELFPFQNVSTPEFEMEYPRFDRSNSYDGMQGLFIEKPSFTKANTSKNTVSENIVPQKNSKNSDDDDIVQFNLFDADDDNHEDLFESPAISHTSHDIHMTTTHITMSKAKPKVEQNVGVMGVRRSVLDDILQTAGTDKEPNMASTQTRASKPGETVQEDFCCICRDDHTDPVVLPKCSHKYCRDCIDQYFKIKPVCPECFVPYGIITGNQPDGHMDHKLNKKITLQGNTAPGAIVVNYSFDNGTQTSEHPNPGSLYYGTGRTAFLPDTPEGHKVLKLLEVAFKRRLVFTVGRSRTTGADNVVTWNDIHHKTSPSGGQANFGYPDSTYLSRVQEELAAVGVTEESLQ